MTFSGLPTPKAGTGWVVMAATSAANPAVASEPSKGSHVSFLTVLGKLKRKGGGRERLLWFLVFCCEKELGATPANRLRLALLHLKVCPSVIFPPSLSFFLIVFWDHFSLPRTEGVSQLLVVKRRQSIAIGRVGCFSSATLLFNYVINTVLCPFPPRWT